MTKLDRLVWAEGISFTSFGVPIGVRVSAPELLDQVLARIPAGWKRRRSAVVDRLYCFAGGAQSQRNMRGFHLLYADVQRLARSENSVELLEIFESDLSSYIAQAARPWLPGTFRLRRRGSPLALPVPPNAWDAGGSRAEGDRNATPRCVIE